MDGNEIRVRFLRFFEERSHTVVPSASLIPLDPSLLLTVAGMVPFKPYLLGTEPTPYPRAVSVQKCIRTADIDVVGTTARHLTFFEMMGNFSFGDYFKEKAIPWAYDLVTEGFELDPSRLWFTVHHSDDEAAAIWIDEVGVPADRVQRRDKDNFWQMGVAGPCGPSSEIFYDRGADYGPDGGPVVDEERFVEIWNLVFMQHVQDEPYHVVGDLPSKNIDTGAGLERVAAVLQEKESVFETDLMRPVMAAAEAATGARFGADAESDVSLRIMADHGRAVTFLIGDKVVPSNEGRGYILRRLLRRAVRHAFLFGVEELMMPKLIAATVDVMAQAYPDLVSRHDAITEMAIREEERFRRTLYSGHQILDQELDALGPGEVFPGATAFKLHDTFGFPRELTEEILAERGVSMDLAEFERMMEEQRERARREHRKTAGESRVDEYRNLLVGLEHTDFVGYETEAGTARILAIVRDGDTVERAGEDEDVEVFLDRTPFYAESGGQVGDTGRISGPTGEVKVADTQYALPAVHGHRGTVTSGEIRVGQDVSLGVDSTRRERIRKNHTGTHVLHWALRDVVGDHVHQAGSLVADDRLRFDFSHYAGLEPDELLEVERVTNERIIENSRVTTLETSRQEAEAMGALAFFGDKYGDRVRVVRVGHFSTEFCGGTHVDTAGQVGPLILVAEGSVAANTRRVEALTGTRAYEHLVALRRQIREAEQALRAQPGRLVEAAGATMATLEAHEERLEALAAQQRSGLAAELLDAVEEHGGKRLVVAAVAGQAPDELRALALQVRERLGEGIVVLGSARDGKGSLVGIATPELVATGMSAGELLGPAARVLGGGGSRDPELAQAGGPHGDRLEEALQVARTTAQEALLSG